MFTDWYLSLLYVYVLGSVMGWISVENVYFSRLVWKCWLCACAVGQTGRRPPFLTADCWTIWFGLWCPFRASWAHLRDPRAGFRVARGPSESPPPRTMDVESQLCRDWKYSPASEAAVAESDRPTEKNGQTGEMEQPNPAGGAPKAEAQSVVSSISKDRIWQDRLDTIRYFQNRAGATTVTRTADKRQSLLRDSA